MRRFPRFYFYLISLLIIILGIFAVKTIYADWSSDTVKPISDVIVTCADPQYSPVTNTLGGNITYTCPTAAVGVYVRIECVEGNILSKGCYQTTYSVKSLDKITGAPISPTPSRDGNFCIGPTSTTPPQCEAGDGTNVSASWPYTLFISSNPNSTNIRIKSIDSAGNVTNNLAINIQFSTGPTPTASPTPTGPQPPTPTPTPPPVGVPCPTGPGGAWTSNQACGDSNYNTIPPHIGLPNGSATDTCRAAPRNGWWEYVGSFTQKYPQWQSYNSWCNTQTASEGQNNRAYCYVCNVPPPVNTPTPTPPPASTPTPIPTVPPGSFNQSYSGPLLWGYVYKDTDNNKQFTSGTDTPLGITENPNSIPNIQGKWIGGATTYTVSASSPNVLRSTPSYSWSYNPASGYTHTVGYGGYTGTNTNTIVPVPTIPWTQTNRSCSAYICTSYYVDERTAIPGLSGVYKVYHGDYYQEFTSTGGSSYSDSKQTSYNVLFTTANCNTGCTIQAAPTYNTQQFTNSSGGFQLNQGRYCDLGNAACQNTCTAYDGDGGCISRVLNSCSQSAQCYRNPPNPNCNGASYYCVTPTPSWTTAAGAGQYDGWSLFEGSYIYRSKDFWTDTYTGYGFKATGSYTYPVISYPGPKIQNPKKGRLLGPNPTELFNNTMTDFCHSPCSCNNDDAGGGSGFICTFPAQDPSMNVSPPGDYLFIIGDIYYTSGGTPPASAFTFTASSSPTGNIPIVQSNSTIDAITGRLSISYYFTVGSSRLNETLSFTLSITDANSIHLGTPGLYPLGVYEAQITIPQGLSQVSYCMNNFNNLGPNTPVTNSPALWNKQRGNQTYITTPNACALSVLGNQTYYSYPHGGPPPASDTLQTEISKLDMVQNDFLLGRPNSISGNIFLDKNKDELKNNGEPNYTGAITVKAINLSTSVEYTDTCTSACDGTYQIFVDDGTYRIEYSNLPSDYEPTYPVSTPPSYGTLASPVSVGNPPGCDPSTTGTSHGATCVAGFDDVINLNFGITDKIVWYQGIGGDMRLDTGISIKVPPGNFANLSGAGLTPGVLFSGDVLYNFCRGAQGCIDRSSLTKWLIGLPGQYAEIFNTRNLKELRTSYSTYVAVAKQNGIALNPLTNLSGCSNLGNCSLSGITNGVYHADGNVTLTNSSFTFPSGHFVILVKGNLTIQNDILVRKGSTLTFSVSGDIYITPNVGVNTATTSCAPTTTFNGLSSGCNIEGFYSANGRIYIQGNNSPGNVCNPDGTPKDRRLNVHGTLIINAARATACNPASQCFVQLRDLCEENANPTVQIQERPDFLIYAPEFLKRRNLIYQEVAP